MSILARQTVRSARTAFRQQQAPMLRRNLHVENTHETVSGSPPFNTCTSNQFGRGKIGCDSDADFVPGDSAMLCCVLRRWFNLVS